MNDIKCTLYHHGMAMKGNKPTFLLAVNYHSSPRDYGFTLYIINLMSCSKCLPTLIGNVSAHKDYLEKGQSWLLADVENLLPLISCPFCPKSVLFLYHMYAHAHDLIV
jgi:hypothetical protein